MEPGLSEDQSEDEDKENEPEDGDDDDEGGGWITPTNIKQAKMDSADWTAPDDVTVGCLTTDFAMQVTRKQVSRTRSRTRTAADVSVLSRTFWSRWASVFCPSTGW